MGLMGQKSSCGQGAVGRALGDGSCTPRCSFYRLPTISWLVVPFLASEAATEVLCSATVNMCFIDSMLRSWPLISQGEALAFLQLFAGPQSLLLLASSAPQHAVWL